MSPTIPDNVFVAADGRPRCFWCRGSEAMLTYHDTEWGFGVSDDRLIFEKICLEGFQSGLSWSTILNKRENFREAFSNFDFERVSRYTGRDVARLLKNAGIVRHRGKIEATVNNARRALMLAEEFGSLKSYFWSREPGKSQRPARITPDVLMTMSTSPESIALSRDLKKRGWSFVGPTTVYAFMQACGLVNDHQHDCVIRQTAERSRRSIRPVHT